MKNWKIWTAFLSVFITGIIVGVVGVGFVLQHHFGKPRDTARFKAMMKERLLSEIREEVRPDASAIPGISKAIEELIEELGAIRKEAHPRVKAAFEKGKEQMKLHLTPEQSKRLDELSAKRRKGKFGFLRLPPPPPPMP